MVKRLMTAYVRRGDIAPCVDVHARVDSASAYLARRWMCRVTGVTVSANLEHVSAFC